MVRLSKNRKRLKDINVFDDTRKSLELYIREIISSDKDGLKYGSWNI